MNITTLFSLQNQVSALNYIIIHVTPRLIPDTPLHPLQSYVYRYRFWKPIIGVTLLYLIVLFNPICVDPLPHWTPACCQCIDELLNIIQVVWLAMYFYTPTLDHTCIGFCVYHPLIEPLNVTLSDLSSTSFLWTSFQFIL